MALKSASSEKPHKDPVPNNSETQHEARSAADSDAQQENPSFLFFSSETPLSGCFKSVFT